MAFGCYVADDAAGCAAELADGLDNHNAPADHLYCPRSLRLPSRLKLGTAAEYIAKGALLTCSGSSSCRFLALLGWPPLPPPLFFPSLFCLTRF